MKDKIGQELIDNDYVIYTPYSDGIVFSKVLEVNEERPTRVKIQQYSHVTAEESYTTHVGAKNLLVIPEYIFRQFKENCER